MKMTTKTIAIAALAVAALTATSAAEAGGGKQLGFGFPLGSFTATPSKGGSYNPAARKASKGTVQQAARKSTDKKTARIEKSEPVAGQKADVDDSAPRITGSSALIQQSAGAGTPVEEAKTDAAPAQPELASGEPATDTGCTKFVPAIGTTVAVECGR
jgi:hypothetical protein